MEEYEIMELPREVSEETSGKSYTIEGQFTEVQYAPGPDTEDTVKEALKKPFAW